MSCTQTLNGIAKDCAPNMGGVKRVFIGNFEEFTTSIAEGTSVATLSAVDSAKLKTYAFPRGLASMTSTATIDQATGAKYFTTEVALFFNRMEATKRLEIMALLSVDAIVVVEDENGKLWLLDKDNPATATASENGTGTAIGDANRYGITLQVMARELPYEVTSIEGLID